MLILDYKLKFVVKTKELAVLFQYFQRGLDLRSFLSVIPITLRQYFISMSQLILEYLIEKKKCIKKYVKMSKNHYRQPFV